MKRYALLLACFIQQMWLLVVEAPVVVFYVKFMQGGLLPKEHPWATGHTPDGEVIWPKNIVYASPSRLEDVPTDAEIVTKVGQFLRSMVKRSVEGRDLPQGPKRRMPHAVNLLHGAVHYNGVFMVFDDCADLVAHVTDPDFRRDLKHFVREERREVTFVLRDRDYSPTEYAYAIAAVRAHLPYFTNGNGPTDKPVLWGNKAPYASLNPINGAWMADMGALWRGELDSLARPPVTRAHFQAAYVGVRRGYTKLERFMAWVFFLDVRARGKRGNIFFTKRERFDRRGVDEYRALGYWRWFNIERVPSPFRSPTVSRDPAGGFSVVLPALNEEANIARAIRAAQRAFDPLEVIVADGGSVDDTCAIARSLGAVVVKCEAGRGQQMRAGARHATGEFLVFLHADAEVAPTAGRAARRFFAASQTNQVATLRLKFGRQNPLYRMLGWVTRLDGYLFSYGDQGILCRRTFYDGLGGMPAQPLFEDVEFFRRARRVARVSSLRATIHASDRRFAQNGVFRELWSNTRMMARYAAGESPERLAEEYRRRAAR